MKRTFWIFPVIFLCVALPLWLVPAPPEGEEAFSGARVFQGGGNEILGNDLQEMVMEAGRNALLRLYPQFGVADSFGWAKVYEKAREGAPDALKSVGYDGEPARNPVCTIIR